MQKPISGARERSLLEQGIGWVAGYAVSAADVPPGSTPAELHALHGLGFPGSPFASDAEFVDLVRMPVTPFTSLLTPLGGPSREAARRMGGDFIDHPPFTGTGFAADTAEFVPVWWLEPSRLPAGATVWRVFADGGEQLVAGYAHIALGWIGVAPGVELAPTPLQSPELLGVFADWQGERLLADLLPTGAVVLCSPHEREGMQLSPRGVWWREVPRGEVERLYAVRVLASWRDLPVQLVGMEHGPDGPRAHCAYVGHDALVAEAAGLSKTDAGVYELVVPAEELSDVREVQTDAPPVEPDAAERTDEGTSTMSESALSTEEQELADYGTRVLAKRFPGVELRVVPLPEDGAVAIHPQVRGGGVLIVAADKSALFAASTIQFPDALREFRGGRRSPITD